MSDNDTKIPTNSAVGVLYGEKAVEEAETDLQKAGYTDVTVMTHVDAVGEGRAPFSELMDRLTGQLSEETDFLDQYKEETERGGFVLAVRAEDREHAEKAREVMEAHGALNVRFFGLLAVSDLTPETNPSAPSDEMP
jgi:hypothetical protein